MELDSCRYKVGDKLGLYLILETSFLQLPLGDFLMQAVEGGVTAVQLRDKTRTAIERFETAKYISSLLKNQDILFIVNDNADIAMISGAHGVHLGPDDLPPMEVRKHFPSLLVGYECNNENDCAVAIDAGVDYINLGPIFPNSTKSSLRSILGIEKASDIASSVKIPVVGVGGISQENIIEIRNSALTGAAVSSALCISETPYDTALKLSSLLNLNQ